MKDWDYDVKQYSRAASATVLVRSGKRDGSQSPEQATFTVSTTWSDYEVESDSEHNVSGHTPDYDAMSSNDRVVAELVADAVPKVAARVGGTCSAASLAASRAEFEAAGLPAPPEGYADVDATAFAAVGGRLLSGVNSRGRSTVGSSSASIPLRFDDLRAQQCFLVVAIGRDSADQPVPTYLIAAGHADLRGQEASVVEVCPWDFGPMGPSERIYDLRLGSKSGGEVDATWAIFTTQWQSPPIP